MENNSLHKVLATNIRQLRVSRSWSQEDLADAAGLHRTYVGAVERAERNITLDTLERLAKALDVDPVSLLRSADGDADS